MTVRLAVSRGTQVFLAFLAPFAAAQAQAPKVARPPTDKVVPDSSRVRFDDGAGSDLWARGATYKASFGADGFTYVPFLGSGAPQNYPVRMSVSHASVGGIELALTAGASASRMDSRITLDRGGLLEVYDLEPDRIEQTFVIADLPVRGELALRIDVQTGLEASDTAAGLEFSCALGSVRYGDVTVLDVRGARIDVPSRLVGDQIAIDVPAAFVAAAQLPLRVDPVILTFYVHAGALQQTSPDIAYDAFTDSWCIVYEEVFSQTDHDVFAVLVDSNGVTLPNPDDYVDFTSDYWSDPSIANDRFHASFLCAATVHAPGATDTYIRGRIRYAASGQQDPQLTLSGSQSGSKLNCNVGGSASLTAPSYFFVIWERVFATDDRDIHGQLVTTGSTLVGTTVHIDNSGSTLDATPRISKTNGLEPRSTQEWNIVWERFVPAFGAYDVLGAQVHWDGVVSTPTFFIDAASANQFRPAASTLLDGNTGPRAWMMVYQNDMGSHHDIWGKVLIGGSIHASINLTAFEGFANTEDQVQPSIDSDGSQFTVAWIESFQLLPSDHDVYASTYWCAGGSFGVSESRTPIEASSNNELAVRIASKHSAGGATNRFGLAWIQDSGGAQLDVQAGFYDSQINVTITAACLGDGSGATCPCSNHGAPGNGCANSGNASGANLSAAGIPDASSDTFVLTGSGMPGTATCLFFQGTLLGTGSPFGDGLRCVAGSVTRLGTKTCVGGTAAYPGGGDVPISLKGGFLLTSGAVRRYQVWYRNAGVYCTTGTFNLTNALVVPWIP